ncbi:MAG: ArsR/SmtB family transcription factor [Bacteroidota bacterium]
MSNYSYNLPARPPDFTRLAELFAALSDPNRLRIISTLLEGERSVGQIAASVNLSESAVSHQLRGLRQMRLVCPRKSGRQVFYSLDDDHVGRLYQMGLEHTRDG